MVFGILFKDILKSYTTTDGEPFVMIHWMILRFLVMVIMLRTCCVEWEDTRVVFTIGDVINSGQPPKQLRYGWTKCSVTVELKIALECVPCIALGDTTTVD